MSSTKYAGYLGGAAVAAGIGAAMAVGGAATAHAETDPGADAKPASSASESTAKPGDKVTAAVKKVASRVQESAATVESGVRKVSSASKSFDPAETVRDLKRGFDRAEAKLERRVAQAKSTLAGDDLLAGGSELLSKATKTARSLKPTVEPAAPAAKANAEANRDSGGGDAFLTNPFRSDDPDPDPAGMYGPLLEVRNAVRDANPIPQLDPVVREGFEAGYRVSQMIPWVNLPIPLLQLATGTHEEQKIAQATVNQLLLTLPPVGIVYYGYDQAADLLNVEEGAAELKEKFFATIWGIDFVNLLHNGGQSGLPTRD
ncbi:hypothetical protein [Mycolicibacterium brumae]|uniref:Uncharacterized protein n=1 Tax=Mycolicibacterium brumae TaxID=85968 RepID=A0A2G5P4Q5_9MYCO|nr:hypothetical protein [Mycolicibacterium brumae]MCV7194872.1 hypothetical protein [Mycolicibacterium brumae]PIB73257.1 hypothetical protein CQY22_017660 [Mycolicibacterium brumae]RWA17869.1 hypothetical protein MBRU_18260 [Mycolicibacterium brumae DSM 44177]UWW09325.1 hypothetical protein L2Z93_002421 [Mycolicibacterium brumae]